MNEITRLINEEITADIRASRMLRITETELVFFLMDTAVVLCDGTTFQIVGEIREWMERSWWEWCMSLSGPTRVSMQAALREKGIALPSHPGDDVLVGEPV
jgi:hypothetical protein